MSRTVVLKILNSMRTEENNQKIDNAINKLNSLSDETVEKICAGKSEDEIKQILENRALGDKKEKIRVDLNDMWYYGRDSNTVHVHLVLQDLHDLKDRLGNEEFKKYMKDKLEDSLLSLQEVIRQWKRFLQYHQFFIMKIGEICLKV